MKFAMSLIAIFLVAGCSTGDFGSSTSSGRKKSQTSQSPGNSSNANGNQAADSAANVSKDNNGGSREVTENESPVAPVPVLGSYLVAMAVDLQGNPVSNAAVNLDEDAGSTSETGYSDAKGLVKLKFADANKISRIRLKRAGASTSTSVLTLTSEDKKALLETVLLESDNVPVPPKLLQIKSDGSGGSVLIASIVNPQTDTTPPSVSGVNTAPDGAGGKLVTINASDAQTGLHDQAYSFDSGVTWSASNQKSFPTGTVLQSGTMRVRDRAGNVSIVNNFNLGL
ncbi:MAG: hypothetical protein ACO3A4_00525 [Silvanigrellaceae bacterium]